MELRGGTDALALRLQGGAVGELGVFEVLNAGKMAVDEHVVGERPEVFGRLQLGRIRRQEQEVDVLGDAQPLAGVPAGAVQDEDDLLGGTGADGAGESGELDCEQGDADRGGEVEERATRGRVHEAHQIAPGEPVAHYGGGALSDWCPDAPQERFQANAVLIGGPHLDLRLGKGGGHLPEERAELFLKSACCSASASAWRGRGACWLCFSRCK